MATNPNRRPAGTPAGGQFARGYHPEPDITLDGSGPDDPWCEFDFDLVDYADQSSGALDWAGEDVPEARDEPEPVEPAPGGVDPALLERARDALEPIRDCGLGRTDSDPEAATRAEAAMVEVGHAVAAEVDRRIAERGEADSPRERAERRREATLEVLGELRPFGTPPGGTLCHPDSSPAAARLIESVAPRFPRDWLAASILLRPPLRAVTSSARAHYAHAKHYNVFGDETESWTTRHWAFVDSKRPPPKGARITRRADRSVDSYVEYEVTHTRRLVAEIRTASEITVPSAKTRPIEAPVTATHEMAHRSEHALSHIGQLEQAFLRRRCVDASGSPTPLRRYRGRTSERVQEGGFVDPYVGKRYEGKDLARFAEVLSVGMQAAIGGDMGGLVGDGVNARGEAYRADPDHRAFVLGCMAVA